MDSAVQLNTKSLMVAVLAVLVASNMRAQVVAAAEISQSEYYPGLLSAKQGTYTPSAIASGHGYKLRDRGFDVFINSLKSIPSEIPIGIYAPGKLAHQIVQQPQGDYAHVSPAEKEITFFGLAAGYGSTGLLAHNTKSGEVFFDLKIDQNLYLVLGDKSVKVYRITGIHHFQAMQPSSPYSDFIDLERSGQKISAEELFYQVYAVPGQLVLQTCISAQGIDNWGRLFVVAQPVEPGTNQKYAMSIRPRAIH